MKTESPKILGVGNPVFDIVGEADADFLAAHKLLKGAACLFDPAVHGEIYAHLKSVGNDIKYSAGGATQNSIRVAQAFSGVNGTTAYIGCVGDDEDARTMREQAESEGMIVEYEVHPTLVTAKCAVAVDPESKERTMCTQLDAANNLSAEFIEKHWDLVRSARIHFSAGFVVTNQPQGMIRIAELCAQDPHKLWGTSFCAEFVVLCFTDQVRQWVDLANYITGNEVEWAAFAKAMDYPEGLRLSEVVRRACETPGWRQKGAKPRIMVCTQGSKPTIVAYRDLKSGEVRVEQYPVIAVPCESIVDSTGCGDSFLGGFLFGLSEGYSLEKCIHLGHIAGAFCIQHWGMSLDLSVLRTLIRPVDQTTGN